MHPLVPNFILKHILAGQHRGSFPAAGLFLDVSGFSQMADDLMAHGQHGAEALAGVMRAVFDPLIDLVCGQGGFVAFSAGDALTALFPCDEREAPAALRALAAAYAIQQHIQTQPIQTTVFGAFKISVRIGLAQGDAHWGILTAGEGEERAIYYFQGAAVEGCAEVEHQAQAGQVLVDAAIRAAAADRLVCAPPGADGVARVMQFAGPWPAAQPLGEEIYDPEVQAAAGRFYPEAVITQSGPGEFRQVVSLFISLPAVSTEAQLERFVSSLFDLRGKYGGLVSHLDFGDKGTNLLLLWGAPLAYENDIERALNFILDLQTVTSIPISAGITYRISHAGFIGGQRFEEYTCFGRGVSLASRFMTSAPRGEIWLDEPLASRAGSRFEVEYVDTMRFKGFQEPQRVYLLLERKEYPEAFFRGDLVGRADLLEQLERWSAPLLRGEPVGMLALTGEAGVGKSRLAHAFMERWLQAESPVQVFLGQADEILRQSLNPLVYWLKRYFSVSTAQGEARSKRNFNRRLDVLIAAISEMTLAEELDRTRSFLGALVGLHWPDSPYEQMDAAGRYANTTNALIALLQAESLNRPVILFLEDVQWLDADTAAFLNALSRALPEGHYPVAVLATSRLARANPLLAGQGLVELPLAGLSPAGIERLAAAYLGGPASPALLEMLTERADGNPFYAEQILHYLQDARFLVAGPQGWDLRPGGSPALPEDVNALLVARLDRLDRRSRSVVQTAAVLGREFDLNLLRQMLDRPQGATLTEVETAVTEAIWVALNETRYLFKHALLRETAYQMQLLRRRQQLHAVAMQAYEISFSGRLDDVAGELAYHAEQAGLREPALRYLRLAGDVAQRAYRNSQAIDAYTRALMLLPGDAAEARCELLLAREAVCEHSGNCDIRQTDLAALEALLTGFLRPDLQIEILLRLGMWASDQSEHSEVSERCRQALELAFWTERPDLAARALWILTDSRIKMGRLEEAQTYAEESLRLIGDARDVTHSQVLNTLGLIATEMGQMEKARASFETSLAIARALNNPRLQMPPVNNLGRIFNNQGDLSAAQQYYEEARQISRKVGDFSNEGLVLGNLGFLAGVMGEFQQAREYNQRSLQIARLTGQPNSQTYVLINQSAILDALGEAQSAAEHANQALELARQSGERSAEAWALTYLGHSRLAQNLLSEAQAAYQAALAIRRELEQPALAAEPCAGLARVALEQGDLPAAQRAFAPVLAHLIAGGALDGADQPVRVYLVGYRVLQQAGDRRAQDLLAEGRRQLQALAEKITNPQTRQAFLTQIPHHRAILAA